MRLPCKFISKLVLDRFLWILIILISAPSFAKLHPDVKDKLDIELNESGSLLNLQGSTNEVEDLKQISNFLLKIKFHEKVKLSKQWENLLKHVSEDPNTPFSQKRMGSKRDAKKDDALWDDFIQYLKGKLDFLRRGPQPPTLGYLEDVLRDSRTRASHLSSTNVKFIYINLKNSEQVEHYKKQLRERIDKLQRENEGNAYEDDSDIRLVWGDDVYSPLLAEAAYFYFFMKDSFIEKIMARECTISHVRVEDLKEERKEEAKKFLEDLWKAPFLYSKNTDETFKFGHLSEIDNLLDNFMNGKLVFEEALQELGRIIKEARVDMKLRQFEINDQEAEAIKKQIKIGIDIERKRRFEEFNGVIEGAKLFVMNQNREARQFYKILVEKGLEDNFFFNYYRIHQEMDAEDKAQTEAEAAKKDLIKLIEKEELKKNKSKRKSNNQESTQSVSNQASAKVKNNAKELKQIAIGSAAASSSSKEDREITWAKTIIRSKPHYEILVADRVKRWSKILTRWEIDHQGKEELPETYQHLNDSDIEYQIARHLGGEGLAELMGRPEFEAKFSKKGFIDVVNPKTGELETKESSLILARMYFKGRTYDGFFSIAIGEGRVLYHSTFSPYRAGTHALLSRIDRNDYSGESPWQTEKNYELEPSQDDKSIKMVIKHGRQGNQTDYVTFELFPVRSSF